MNRHAAWIRRPEDPTTAWRWILSTGLRFKPEQRRLFIVTLAVMSGVSLALGSWLTVLGFALVALAATFFQPQSREHASLLDFSDRSTFPVALTLIRNRRTTGRDVGWICFIDGWLVYEGMRTGFSVTPKGPATVMLNNLVIVLPDGQIARFGLLKDPRGSRFARIDPRTLRATFDEWKLGIVPPGDPVFPPSAAHPAATAQKLKERLVWTAFLGLAAAICTAFPLPSMATIFLCSALLQLALFVFGFLRFRRELKISFGPTPPGAHFTLPAFHGQAAASLSPPLGPNSDS